jgi:hypothetical protein
MLLHYNFKQGKHQAGQARNYFNALAADLMEGALAGVEPVQYFIEGKKVQPLAIRVWSDGTGGLAHTLVPWVRAVLSGLGTLVHHPGLIPKILPRLAYGLSQQECCFIEVLDPRTAYTAQESDLFCACLEDHRAKLISAPDMMFVQLADKLSGVSVRDVGSWLIEEDLSHTDEPVHVYPHGE